MCVCENVLTGDEEGLLSDAHPPTAQLVFGEGQLHQAAVAETPFQGRPLWAWGWAWGWAWSTQLLLISITG